MPSDEIVIDVQNISKRYEIYASPRDRLKQYFLPRLQRWCNKKPKQHFREFWALRDVSFQIKRGETFGIIGRNGGGKSTLLQILAGILRPTCGIAKVQGRIAALLELGSGFNPEFTGRENVYMNATILGLSKSEIDAHYEQIIEFADIGEFIHEPVKTYSSGMFVRLAFAVQAHINANIVIIDEALAVGDIFFRQKCYARLEELKAKGAAILLVSHSMPDIEQYCDRALVLEQGVPKFLGPASEAAKHYYLLHQPKSSATKKLRPIVTTEPLLSNFQNTFSPPSPDAFLDLTHISQINNGQAHCTGIALSNILGEPCQRFQQGDLAIFYSEYTINECIEVPIYGVIIKNERNIIVHGKNSWQCDNDVPTHLQAGDTIRCKQEIRLDLAPGEYVFDLGFTSVSTEQWKNKAYISHEQMSAAYINICQMTNISVFSIGLSMKNGIAMLTHHGISDLPGTINIAITQTEKENQLFDCSGAVFIAKKIIQEAL